jgi:S1-C subfamily serine protease
MVDNKQVNGQRYNGFKHDFEPPVPVGHRVAAEDFAFDLVQTLDAVFGLEAQVPADAFTAAGLGTAREGNGVLIDSVGHVLTIGYLVTEAEHVTLTAANGRKLTATPIGFDQVSGFGLVRLAEPWEAPPIPFGTAGGLQPGDEAIMAGQGGVRRAQRVQVVSRRPFAGYWEYLLDEAIFTVPPHQRWSGAGLIGKDGKLYGIASLFVQDATPGESNKPGNMVVPIDLLPPILDDLLMGGRANRVSRPWLGLFTAEAQGKLVVAGVSDTGPAQAAGVEVGDILLSIGGDKPTDLMDFYRRLWATGPAGIEVPLEVYRDGRVRRLTVKSADRYALLKAPSRH